MGADLEDEVVHVRLDEVVREVHPGIDTVLEALPPCVVLVGDLLGQARQHQAGDEHPDDDDARSREAWRRPAARPRPGRAVARFAHSRSSGSATVNLAPRALA
jgi:hypothetical protein